MIDELQEQYEQEQDPEKQLDIRKQIHEELIAKQQFEIDLDNLPPQAHNWVQRGVVISCEGAGHLNHRHRGIKVKTQ